MAAAYDRWCDSYRRRAGSHLESVKTVRMRVGHAQPDPNPPVALGGGDHAGGRRVGLRRRALVVPSRPERPTSAQVGRASQR